MVVKYERQGEAIVWVREYSTQSLAFRAEKLTEERTGVHARLTINLQSTSLASGYTALLSWSYLNIERAEDRTRLANSAHAAIGNSEFSATYTKEELRKDLDRFCLGLWDFDIAAFTPEEMTGDEGNTSPVFLLWPYLLEGGGTILFAPPGRGKSYSGLLWAVSVDAGNSTFWPVTKNPVLYVNLERSRASLSRRLARVNFVLGEDIDRPLGVLNARGKSLQRVFPACQRWVKEHKTGLVILDSLSRAGLGDLNENQPVNRAIDMLSSLCPSWVALGHTSRASEDHVFGSIMADAGADLVIQLSSQIKESGTLGIGWEVVKQNDMAKTPMAIWALDFDPGGLTACRRAKDGEFPEVESRAKQDMASRVLAYLINCDSGEATAMEIEKETGFHRSNISHLLNTDHRFVKRGRTREGQFFGVANFPSSSPS